MLSHYLKTSIENIQDLIELTRQDIGDIKIAKHVDIFQRTKIKSDLIRAFESKKSLLDNELLKLVRDSDGKELEEVLSSDEKYLLSEMKEKLSQLKSINKEYARFVVTVGEFYNSLLDKVFPRDMEGYKKSIHKPASLFKIRA
ncbi:MAG: hypothetical protein PHN38_04010 [Sulfurospirillaceae bacterium]|nr:hypothetical protein [Sulfurospirillaceae bacterium]